MDFLLSSLSGAMPFPAAADDYPTNPTSDYFSCSVEDYVIENPTQQEVFLPPQHYPRLLPPQTDDDPRMMNFPPGFRFRPTDEELIIHYLQLESLGVSSASKGIISHADIYDYEPHQLSCLAVDHGDGKMYLYTRIKKIGKSKTERSIKSKKGNWKATQKTKTIKGRRSRDTLGYKTSLVYVEGKKKTQWLMQEYRLESHASHHSSQELVLAVVYHHHRGRREDDDNS